MDAQLNVQLVFIALRMAERILAVLVGAMLVYLGYQLFVRLPELKDAEGNLKLPNNISVFMSNIGPGAFFALFGAAVLVTSLSTQTTYSNMAQSLVAASMPPDVGAQVHAQDADEPQPTPVPATSISLMTEGEDGEVGVDPTKLRDIESYIKHLNSLPDLLDPEQPIKRRQPLLSDIPQIKAALMETVWSTDWGHFQTFEAWVIGGGAAVGPGSAEIGTEAMELFNSTEEATE